MDTTTTTTVPATTNFQRFEAELAAQYKRLFAEDKGYAFVAERTTPESLAHTMAHGLTTGLSSKDGEGVRLTCRALGVPYTYAAIREFLGGEG